MTRAGIAKLALIVAVLSGVGWWLSEDAPTDSNVEEGDTHGISVGDTGPAIEDWTQDSSRLNEALRGPSRTVAAAELATRFGHVWADRYPDAVATETRLVRLADNRYRLQTLLSTGIERLPWVIWEEKLRREEDGTFTHFGSVAHVGNGFLAEVREEFVDPEDLAAFIEEHDLFVERRSRVADYWVLGIRSPELGKVESLVDAFLERFPDALAEFDTLSFPATTTPSDWDGSRMWGLDTIQARDAWTFEQGDSATDVVIAIIDTGTDRNHPDIAGNLFTNPRDNSTNGEDDDSNGLTDDVSGWDFMNGDADPDDEDGHGTHVAGIAGAKGNNGVGAVGVNWGVKLLPLKVGDANGLRTSAINDSLAYVRQLKGAGVNIVATNNSYGSGSPNQTTRNEISRHEELGILFVAAAGNSGRNMDTDADSREYPAGYSLDIIISVANSNQEDVLNSSSNYGVTSVDLSAPGTEIYAPFPNNAYSFLSGTSMASPMVAGAVGLLAQAEPNLGAAQIKERLMQTGDLLASQEGLSVSGRRLNLAAALRPALSGHDIAVSNVSDFVVLLDGPEGEVEFRIEALPEAEVSAALVSGSNLGSIKKLRERVYRFVPEANGQATVRFTSSRLGIERSVERTIVVGNVNPTQSGLIHHFAFGGTGNTVADLAGTSNGSLEGATRENSRFGSSLRIDESTEKLSFNGRFSDSVTIAALVRSDDLRASPHPRIVNMPFYYLYFSTGDGPGIPDGNRETLKFFSFFDENPGNPSPAQSGIGVWNAPPRSIAQNQWFYVVGTYDSSSALNTPKLYINSEPQVVRVQSEPRGSIVKTEGESFIGNNAADSRVFDGLMADVRIYDRELSPSEVSTLGASLVRNQSGSFRVEGPRSVAMGDVFQFEVVDDAGSSDLNVSWHVVGEGGYAVVSEGGASGGLRFDEAGVVRLAAQVSDGLSTRVIFKEVDVIGVHLKAGLAGGQITGSGSNGVYVEFVEYGQSASAGLQAGSFSDEFVGEVGVRSLSLVSSDRKSYRIEYVDTGELVDKIAQRVLSRDIALDGLNVQGIRAQVPVSSDSVGAVAFSIEGEGTREVLLRALGPSFSSLGLSDPRLELFRLVEGEALPVARNDDWGVSLSLLSDQDTRNSQASLEQGFEQLGLSRLDSLSLDAAQRVLLLPGEYLLLVELSSGDPGTALIEVFGL